MMKKIINKNVILFVIGLITIIIIISIPFIIEQYNESKMVGKAYSMKRIEFSLDSDIANIEMVNRLHEAIGSVYSEETTFYLQNGESNNLEIIEGNKSDRDMELCEELNKMNEMQGFNNIFKDLICNNNSSWITSELFDTSEEIIKLNYIYEDNEIYTIYDTVNKKILEFTIYSGDLQALSNESKKEILEAMIDYLNLKIVGDWQYDGEVYVSKKAHITFVCELKEKYIKVYSTLDGNY